MARLKKEIQAAATALRPALPPLSRQEWWRGAALYQVYLRSFYDSNGDGIGDLEGVRQKLDYIAGLNVDGVWLSPFFPSPQKDFGYDISDFRGVDPIFGTLQDFDRLLTEAHDRGLRLLIDLVPGHTSDEHPWFTESRSSRDNRKADWYIWADPSEDGTPPNNWMSSFGGPAWEWEPRRAQYYYRPFLPCQPALDLLQPGPREALLANMRFWLDRGIDGFRVDAVQCIACDPDLRDNPPVPSSGSQVRIGGGPNNPFARQSHYFDRDVPEAFDVIGDMRAVCDSYDRDRVMIGELADIDSSRLSEKYTAQGLGFHAVYDFDLIHEEGRSERLTELLHSRDAFMSNGWLMNVFTNHDSLRSVSNLTEHAVEAGLRREAAKLLLFMQFALKGGGIVYQGEELGLPQPELSHDQLRDPWALNLWPDFEGRDGARTPMPWCREAPHGGFTTAEAPWMEVAAEHLPLAVDAQQDDPDSCLAFATAWLEWRKAQPLLRFGGERTWPPETPGLVAWDRFSTDETLTCLANFGLEPCHVPRHMTEDKTPLAAPGVAMPHGGRLVLPPLAFALLHGAQTPAVWRSDPLRIED